MLKICYFPIKFQVALLPVCGQLISLLAIEMRLGKDGLQFRAAALLPHNFPN